MDLARTSTRLYQSILHESSFETANVFYPDGWRLQQDNAPADRFTRPNDQFFYECSVNSPDLMSIENLWSWMKCEVEKKRPKNKTELEAEMILNVWEGLRQLISKTILRIYDNRQGQRIANIEGRTKHR